MKSARGETSVTIHGISPLAEDVRHFVVERPRNFRFVPGQSVELAVDSEDFREEKRPFSIISRPEDEHLEFCIKVYPAHGGVTKKLSELLAGDKLLLGEPFGTLRYRGPGDFFAGGTGITPFLSIFRERARRGELAGQHLFYVNRTEGDIILPTELSELLGDRATFMVTHETSTDCENGTLDEPFLRARLADAAADPQRPDAQRLFYVCGPPGMVTDVHGVLRYLGIPEERIVTEELSGPRDT
jgi:ferredoxin-NADP reductase